LSFTVKREYPRRSPTACVKARWVSRRVSGIDTPRQRQAGQQRLCHGDLIGLFAHAHLEQGFLAPRGTESQQMGSDLSWGSRSTHCFPIEGHGILLISGQGGTHPARQRPFEWVAGEARKKPAGEGGGGAERPTWSKQTRA
jgi:hypothetical protein